MIRSLIRRLVPISSGDTACGLDTRTNALTGSSLTATLTHPEGIDRREFGRRIFAIGAGIAAGGALIRQVPLRELVSHSPFGPRVVGQPYVHESLDEVIRRVYSEPFFIEVHEDSFLIEVHDASGLWAPGRSIRMPLR